ncbi:hypothetical protein A9R05_39775 (plasmid) [Burkholderia sp. KK1]|nr:hypothetical protein A9R05_39775 [Burkholderia sp. KK1]
MQSVASPLLRYSDNFAEDPASLVASACKMKLEGIIGKRGDAPMRRCAVPLRTFKRLDQAQMQPQARVRHRRLLAREGRQDGRALVVPGRPWERRHVRYAGHVAPHLTSTRSAAFGKRAQALLKAQPAFYYAPQPERDREIHWLAPDIVAEVSFLGWSPNGEIRHPLFHALREVDQRIDTSKETKA